MRACILFVILFNLSVTEAGAQSASGGTMCKVIYSYIPLDYYVNRKNYSSNFYIQPVEYRLAICGSLALYYHNPGETDLLLGKKYRNGIKLINHSNLYDFEKQLVFHEVINLHRPELSGLIRDSLRPVLKWELFDMHKNIQGYDCLMALHVNEKQDSILAWYTNQLPLQQSFGRYMGLPGLLLEAYDQVRGEHIIARKIKWQNKMLQFPTGFPQYTAKEWQELLKNLPPVHGQRIISGNRTIIH